MASKSILILVITLGFVCSASASKFGFLYSVFGKDHFYAYTPAEFSLGGLPNGTSVREYEVDVPDGTHKILVYLFVLATVPENPVRGYYRIYTVDNDGRKYTQFMNVGFAQNDYTINSANLWLNIFSEKKFYICLHAKWPLPTNNQEQVTFTSIEDTLTKLHDPSSTFVSGVFLTGYREEW